MVKSVNKKPCKNCPFLKKGCPSLTEYFNSGVFDDVVIGDKSHTCHKTNHLRNPILCAGKLLFESKTNKYGSSSTRIAMSLRLVNKDYSNLGNPDLVFDTIEDFKKYHKIN